MEHHQLLVEAQSDDDVLFVCERAECGRRLVVGRTGLTVLERGDFFAHHSGGSVDLEVHLP
jgi:hypothetical protein